jgi:hypothetical protein
VTQFQEARIFLSDPFFARCFGIEGDGGVLDIVPVDRGDGGNVGPGEGAEGKIGHGAAQKKKTAAFVSCGPNISPTKFLD